MTKKKQTTKVEEPVVKETVAVVEQPKVKVPEIKTKPKSIILEPDGRNTAPAIAIGALKSIEKGDDPILLILSSDHEIKDSEKFRINT